jgi:hypothetical protein
LNSVTSTQYTDLAHAAWMLRQVAGLADTSQIVADTTDPKDELATGWRSYEADYPWL